MRKLVLLSTVISSVLFFATCASAQQGDAFFGGGTLLSSSPSSTALANGNIAEKGGTYLNVGGDVVAFKKRLGFMVETSWRASQASYQGYLTYRPIFTDFNALWQPRLGKKVGLDVFGGIGIAATRFYVPYATSCNYFSGCINYNSEDHFMQHAGVGIRYYVWHHFFVRPEVHYYHIDNNDNINTGGFTSDNVFRVGGSIGYTIGPD